LIEDKLAILGGKPLRTESFPKRKVFGLQEAFEMLDALKSQNLFFAGGKKVYQFQNEFANLYNVKYALTSTSGTAAIHVALGALNLEPGSEVITTPISDMGTVAPIVLQNCIPVFADIDLDTFNLDPDDAESKITNKTKAIIVVHCFGQPADMDRFMEIARKNDVHVIEDCAQAHLTYYKGKLVGTIGNIGAFSFQQSKHMTCGDGGITITNDDDLAKRAALFIDKGCDWTPDRRYRLQYSFFAPCYRMTELEGAILLAQIKKLKWVVTTRQKLGDMLTNLISDINGIFPPKLVRDIDHRYWSFPIRVDETILKVSRDDFKAALSAEGIPVGGPWPGKPLYLFDALTKKLAFGTSKYPWDFTTYGRNIKYEAGICPNAELAERQLINIPINEFYQENDIEDISKAMHKIANYYTKNCQSD
jgi:dTDP-4-amino-4,6-dideoxygalactose transaminase